MIAKGTVAWEVLIAWMAIISVAGAQRTGQHAEVRKGAQMEHAIATLREAYAAFNRGDMDAAVNGLDPNIAWSEPVEFPGGGAYRGREAVKAYLTQSRANWAEGSSEPERFIISGNRVVVFVHARFRLKDSKEWNDVKLADVYTVRDGKIVAMRAFADRGQALHWAEGDVQAH